jgi:L-fuconolactonase
MIMSNNEHEATVSGGGLGPVPAVASDWVELTREDVLDPNLPIVDAHHHLWDHRGRYLLDEILADIGSGHNVLGTVHVDADAMYNVDADARFAAVGETEFINGIAAMSASGLYGPARVCAGIVGFVDLRQGRAVEPLLEAHLQRAGMRFKGIRQCSAFDLDPAINTTPIPIPPGLLLDAAFRDGFSRLAPLGLSFDGWLYHSQIGEFADLADAFPGTTLVLDHVGAPLAIGTYAGRREEVFAVWRQSIADLARRPNVVVKLGGLGMTIFDFGFERLPAPASSAALASAWSPYVLSCIESFGPDRCMFESNFPVDKVTCSYRLLWNTFKRIASGASEAEKSLLFSATATRVYRLRLGERHD